MAMRIDQDDKYTKRSKYDDENGFNSIKVPTHLFAFACFVLASFAVLAKVGLYTSDMIDSERFVVLQVEILGLVMLREKIKNHKSVTGISGTTFVMYALVYLWRTIDAFSYRYPWDPEFRLQNLGLDPVLGIVSFLLVLDILKSIFVTRRETYDAELDVLKTWYLIPACFAFALFVHVQFEAWSFSRQYLWNAFLYMDVLALMPQVAMMAMSGGKVTTPVANFVAATTVSRFGDVSHTILSVYQEWQAVSAEDPDAKFDLRELSGSTWLVIGIQFIHLVLVADFMYYYCKIRTWEGKESDEVTLDV